MISVMVYRFRVTYDDHEDVYRDIDIKSSQTFLDFHSAIQQAVSFDNSKPAIFYMSDDYWRKEREISTENTGEETIKKAKVKKDEPPKKKIIADFVNDPHQKFVYVFDPEKEWTFLIQLIKILPLENISYPLCMKSVGASPKQYKDTNLPPPIPEDDDDGIKKTMEENDLLTEPAEEKISSDEVPDAIVPLIGEDIEGAEGKEKSEEEGAPEDEDGESSEGFDIDDDD